MQRRCGLSGRMRAHWNGPSRHCHYTTSRRVSRAQKSATWQPDHVKETMRKESGGQVETLLERLTTFEYMCINKGLACQCGRDSHICRPYSCVQGKAINRRLKRWKSHTPQTGFHTRGNPPRRLGRVDSFPKLKTYLRAKKKQHPSIHPHRKCTFPLVRGPSARGLFGRVKILQELADNGVFVIIYTIG